MLNFYGIDNCDTCRKARRWLEAHGIEYRRHDLRMDGVTIQMLDRWSKRLDWEKLLNKRSLTWRKIPELDRQDLTRGKALSLMLENPTLIKRPILESPVVTAVGFTEEGYRNILDRLGHQA